MLQLIIGLCLGFMVGYPLGLLVDTLDRNAKNGRR
jgi:4-amino-4-deoxy-L-arabinose transferase-like glycosyltransferase